MVLAASVVGAISVVDGSSVVLEAIVVTEASVLLSASVIAGGATGSSSGDEQPQTDAPTTRSSKTLPVAFMRQNLGTIAYPQIGPFAHYLANTLPLR